MCVCVLCSYSVVETKNHTRMRCLKIGHPKIPRLIIVSEYSKWPEIGERPHFWAPISPLYCIPSPLNPDCCWLFLVASPSNIPIVKHHSYWLLVLTISHISGHWILHISGRSFGSPRVLRGLSWTRHSEYSESQQVDMANFDSNI